MLNITRDTGEFLAVLVKATLARRVLEHVDRLFDTVARERHSRDRWVCDDR